MCAHPKASEMAKRGTMMEGKREQVAKQCAAVAHMANALAEVHATKAQTIRIGGYGSAEAIEWVGRSTAGLMETLGDILNGMDAVDEQEDSWIDPVMEEAHRLWPQK
jgi:hypothetical protein